MENVAIKYGVSANRVCLDKQKRNGKFGWIVMVKRAGLRRCGKSFGIALMFYGVEGGLDMEDRMDGKGFHKHVAIV